MLLRYPLLAFVGFYSDGVIATGIFAFLAIIDVYPRLIGKTGTHKHIFLYETLTITGEIVGNVVDLYEVPIRTGGFWFLRIFRLSVGVFMGCLVMPLAETLRMPPVMNRRVRLAVGIRYMTLSIGLGKLLGSLFYPPRATKDG